MKFQRASGVLLHPTSLPGEFGVGSFDKEAYDWVDFLQRTEQTFWQVLPLGPTSYGDSPYQSFSTFAGNPYLIGLNSLLEEGLLKQTDLDEVRASIPPDPNLVDFGALYNWKMPLLKKVAAAFAASLEVNPCSDYADFCAENSEWLEDYSLFMALKDVHNGVSWNNWPIELRSRQAKAINAAKREYQDLIDIYKVIQFIFFKQWNKLKKYANDKNIKIIGDLPIFVAADSADAWVNASQFYFDKEMSPVVVAGVPPDGFSDDGQLWGNPLYNWPKMKRTGYKWWISRVKAALSMYDTVRIDHFRGFCAYWEVLATEKTAINGRWVKGPGADLFNKLYGELGEDLSIIAEDLGEITPDVFALRDKFGFPGMKVLQFAFGGPNDHPFLPHTYSNNYIAYTGTHDNNTSRGWYLKDSKPSEQDLVRRYFATDGWDVSWTFIRGIFASCADVAIVPLQDILSLDDTARMNVPGTTSGNWRWRFRKDMLPEEAGGRLLELTLLYGRERTKKKLPADPKAQEMQDMAFNPQEPINLKEYEKQQKEKKAKMQSELEKEDDGQGDLFVEE